MKLLLDQGLITLDADFHALVVLSGVNSPSVVRIRIEGLTGQNAALLIQKIVTQYRLELETGER